MWRNRILTIIGIIAVVGLFGCLGVGSAWGKTSIQEAYNCKNLIRLHIIANSNSVVDQQVKLKVRNKVVEMTEKLLLQVEDEATAEALLRANLEKIAETARMELLNNQVELPVKAEYGSFFFPERQYPFGVLGAGKYKSLRVILGVGEGRNWWCVLYPPLCLLAPEAPTFCGTPLEEPPKVEYRLALLEKWLGAKNLKLNDYWKGWERAFAAQDSDQSVQKCRM